MYQNCLSFYLILRATSTMLTNSHLNSWPHISKGVSQCCQATLLHFPSMFSPRSPIISHILCFPQICHILLHFLSPAHLSHFLDPFPPHSILDLPYIPVIYQSLSVALEPLKFPFPLMGPLHSPICTGLIIPSRLSCLLFQLKCEILREASV